MSTAMHDDRRTDGHAAARRAARRGHRDAQPAARVRHGRRDRAGPARRGHHDPPQRVRGDHGAVGLGQVHPDEPDRLPRHARPRASTGSTATGCPNWATTSWPGSGTRRSGSCSRPSTSCPAPTALHNVELPLVYAGVGSKERASAGHGGAGPGRAGRPDEPPAQRALRRPAPAGGDRPGAGQPPQHPPGRRADRQPRLDHQRRDHGAVRRAAPGGPDHRAGHPRTRHRRPRRTARSTCTTARSSGTS